MWDEDREGPVELFSLPTEILAVEGATAVVRAEVRYETRFARGYRDLWIMHMRDDGRCSWFEQWLTGLVPYSVRDEPS
jgi:hypothetical protein